MHSENSCALFAVKQARKKTNLQAGVSAVGLDWRAVFATDRTAGNDGQATRLQIAGHGR